MIYLTFPYSDDSPHVVKARVIAASRMLGMLQEEHQEALCPLLARHVVGSYGWFLSPYESKEAISLSSELVVLCLPGWNESLEVGQDIRLAGVFKKPIQYVLPRERGIGYSAICDDVKPKGFWASLWVALRGLIMVFGILKNTEGQDLDLRGPAKKKVPPRPPPKEG